MVSSVALLMMLSFVLGLGLGCAQPIIMSLSTKIRRPAGRGKRWGCAPAPNGSHTLIPSLGCAVAAAGMQTVFWILAVILLGGAGLPAGTGINQS